MVIGALDFVWTSYSGLHMLFGSLREETYPKFSHIVRSGSNCQSTTCSTSLNRNVVLVTFTGPFLQSKQFWGNCACPVTYVYCTIKKCS